MSNELPKPKRRILVCGRGVCADRQVSLKTEEKFRQLMTDQGLDDMAHEKSVSCKLVNCLGVCMDGPIVMVHPDGVLYQAVGEADAEQIFNEHLLNDQPVERLMHRQMRPKPRRRVKR